MPNSDIVRQLDFKSSTSTTIASIIRTFEPSRDLLTQVENKWSSTSISKHTYISDTLARRTSVVMNGSGAGGTLDRFRSRAVVVVVVDKSNRIAYVEYMSEISQEPNYDGALAAAKRAVG